MEKIRIILVDDSRIILDGLKINLESSGIIEIIGTAINPVSLFELLKEKSPHILLLDIALESDDDGIMAAKTIGQLYPAIRIIMLSHSKDVASIVHSIQAGAHAYLSKDSSIDELIQAIKVVKKGNGIFLGETIPPETLRKCFSGSQERKNFRPYQLTEREIEIIELLAKGYMTKEIAELLFITNSTVESHKENIKEKLQVKSVVEIVVCALKNKIIL
ncbi:MAG: response regulator transcription factor [Bacteroidales bacterium]|jgi:DNA-binding NarL/FixJ family response regulator